jgi:4-hydroxy-2-oxoheptanedioate aldolase
MQENKMKHKLAQGEVVLGTWMVNLRVNALVNMIARSGFDFMYIDMEHSGTSLETIADLCLVAQLSGITPIVRPSGKLPHLLSKPLDCGAMGLLIPHVDTPEEARDVVQHTKYYPLGEKGMPPPGVQTGFTVPDRERFFETMNRETILIAQIESKMGIDRIDEILSVDGIDAAVIGRSDLSQDLKIPGQTKHPKVIECVEHLIEACKKHGTFPGLLVNSIQEAKEWMGKGIKIVPFGNETNILMKAYKEIIDGLRS